MIKKLGEKKKMKMSYKQNRELFFPRAQQALALAKQADKIHR